MVNIFPNCCSVHIGSINFPAVCDNYRFGNPTAFGGHFEAYAFGHLCHISGNSTESSLDGGANKKHFSGEFFKIS